MTDQHYATLVQPEEPLWSISGTKDYIDRISGLLDLVGQLRTKCDEPYDAWDLVAWFADSYDAIAREVPA